MKSLFSHGALAILVAVVVYLFQELRWVLIFMGFAEDLEKRKTPVRPISDEQKPHFVSGTVYAKSSDKGYKKEILNFFTDGVLIDSNHNILYDRTGGKTFYSELCPTLISMGYRKTVDSFGILGNDGTYVYILDESRMLALMITKEEVSYYPEEKKQGSELRVKNIDEIIEYYKYTNRSLVYYRNTDSFLDMNQLSLMTEITISELKTVLRELPENRTYVNIIDEQKMIVYGIGIKN
jgi:hypothetical protein